MVTYKRPSDFIDFLQIGIDRTVPDFRRDEPGLALNLGAGRKLIAGTVALDLPEWDADKDPIPYDDETVSAIYAIHFLEHVHDPLALLRECQRVLFTGGHLNVVVPYWNTELAHSDPDHKSFWSEETWDRIFNNPYYDKHSSYSGEGWKFIVGINLIAGIVERNKVLVTQLIKA
jgi:SAM-dependent methyltransferase